MICSELHPTVPVFDPMTERIYNQDRFSFFEDHTLWEARRGEKEQVLGQEWE